MQKVFPVTNAVRNVFREYIEPLADSFETDGLGSAVAKKSEQKMDLKL